MPTTRNPKPSLNPQTLKRFRGSLADWYSKNRRDLPWRRTRDPYSIWISEMMLQQTRVDTVIPYYERFLSRYPTVEDLANAETDQVLNLWSGLGYYQRARSLHSAAKEIVSRFNGKLPDDPEKIRELPGIGPYSAGAILSIAFEKKQPILDGNVIRLLSRVFLLGGDPAQAENRERLWQLAAEVLPQKNFGDFNQAMMEIAALICTPRAPKCPICPLQSICRAFQSGDPEKYPEKAAKQKSTTISYAFAIVRRNGSYLLFRREKSPMKGMWEFPSVEAEGELFAMEQLRKHLQDDYSVSTESWGFAGSTKHSIMNHRISASYFIAEAKKGAKSESWISREKMDLLPLTTLTKKGLKFDRQFNRLARLDRDGESTAS